MWPPSTGTPYASLAFRSPLRTRAAKDASRAPSASSSPVGVAPIAARSLRLTNTEHQPAHSGSRSTIDGMIASQAATTSVPGQRDAVVADEARHAGDPAQQRAERGLGRAGQRGDPADRPPHQHVAVPGDGHRPHALPAEPGEQPLGAGLHGRLEPQRALGLGPRAGRAHQRRADPGR